MTTDTSIINVSQTFEVVYSTNHAGFLLARGQLVVTWDPTQVELVSWGEYNPVLTSGMWSDDFDPNTDTHLDTGAFRMFIGGDDGENLADGSYEWVTLTFHCLAEGIAIITPDAGLTSSTGGSFGTTEDFPVQINQIISAVGGMIAPVNKLIVLTPYIALLGLIVIVSIVYTIKKSRG